MDMSILSKKFCEYSVSMKGFSVCTIVRYRQVLKYYCNFAQINNLEEATKDNIRSLFYDGRTERAWKPNTFLHYYKTLMVFFNWCVKSGYIASNPMVDIEVPRLEKKLPSKLTKQEAMKILEIIYNYPWDSSFLRHRNYAIFSTFLFAGLRKQELLNLKFMDVDIENQFLFIRQGKGNKDRVIPISFSLAQGLKNYVAERVKLKKTCPQFFASLNNNVGLSKSGLRNLIEKIKISSNIDFAAHKLRHTFATLMLEGGCDIYSLSKMMGHSDIKTTTIYSYASIEHLRGEMTKHPLNDM